MKNSTAIAIGTLLIGLSSCGGSSEKRIISVEKKVNYQKLPEVHANRKLALEVSGMSCEHACGGSIRMALKETGAVERVSYDFETDRETNMAYIYFDKSKISVDEIVNIIEDLNDQQFTTGKATSTDFDSKETTVGGTSSTTSSNEKSKVSMNSSAIEVPNLAKIFTSLIQ